MSFYGIPNPLPISPPSGGLSVTDFLVEVSKGNIAGHSIVSKFGANLSLANSFEPISISGLYNTPQVAAAATLRVKAGNVNDTAAGLGAREITIEGLDATGAFQTASIATAGASASSNFAGTWLRVFRAYVSASGVYGGQGGGSHVGDITIETSGSVDWLTINSTNFARGQSQIGCYSVPLGFTAFVLDYGVTVDANKTVDFAFFKRENILETAAPYSAVRLVFEERALTTPYHRTFKAPLEFSELTDLFAFAKGSQSPEVTVDFEILLIDNNYL